MHVCHFVSPLPSWQSSQLQAPNNGGGVIVLNLFHNQKEDFLSLHWNQGKQECVSAPVFPFLRNPTCYCTVFSEFIRFIQTMHAKKTRNDLCPVNSPVSVNSKIYSWLSKLTSSSPCAYAPSELSQVMRMCWNVNEWQDWLAEYMGLNEAEFITLLTSVKRLTWVSVIWLILVDKKPGKEDLNIYYNVVTFIRDLILPKQ